MWTRSVRLPPEIKALLEEVREMLSHGAVRPNMAEILTETISRGATSLKVEHESGRRA